MPLNASSSSEEYSCSLRGRIWKILLGIGHYELSEYIGLVEKEKCEVYNKIRCDTPRTMHTDREYNAKVKEDQLIRILNSFCLYSNQFDDEGAVSNVLTVEENCHFRNTGIRFSYVQGMNVLAAPFLYCMPEIDAFYSFAKFVRCRCPTYVQPLLEGVHEGVKLLDEILEIVDSELFLYLQSKNLKAEVYAFPTVMTFSACTPPLLEGVESLGLSSCVRSSSEYRMCGSSVYFIKR